MHTTKSLGEPDAVPATLKWPQDDTSCAYIDPVWLHVLATFLAGDPRMLHVLHRCFHVALHRPRHDRAVPHKHDRSARLRRTPDIV